MELKHLTEKDLHCAAKILQGAIRGDPEDGLFTVCNYCKYYTECFYTETKEEPPNRAITTSHIAENFKAMRERLTAETGVDLIFYSQYYNKMLFREQKNL